MTSLATHVSVFLRERLPLEKRASDRTCETYALALRLFFEFTAQELKIRPSSLRLEHLDAPRVQAFLEHLEKQRHNSPATRNVRLAAIRTVMRFIEHREPAALEQVQRIRAIPMKRTESRLVNHLTPPIIDQRRAWPDSICRHVHGTPLVHTSPIRRAGPVLRVASGPVPNVA
jgi:site-specific recombinase XerD